MGDGGACELARGAVGDAAAGAVLPLDAAGEEAGPHGPQLAQPAQRWRWRRPGRGYKQGSKVTDQRGVDLVSLVAAELGSTEVFDLGGIDQTDDVAGLVQRQCHAETVAAGRFQAGMHAFELVLPEPDDQGAPTLGRVGEAPAARLAADDDIDIERVF